MSSMTYEDYLDEVTTLITEKYPLSDDEAIQCVMQAQENGFFCAHDEDASLRTLDRAHQDARTLGKQKH